MSRDQRRLFLHAREKGGMSQKKIPDGCDWGQRVLLMTVKENTSSKKEFIVVNVAVSSL